MTTATKQPPLLTRLAERVRATAEKHARYAEAREANKAAEAALRDAERALDKHREAIGAGDVADDGKAERKLATAAEEARVRVDGGAARLKGAETKMKEARRAELALVAEEPNAYAREMLGRAAEIRDEVLTALAGLRSADKAWAQLSREWRVLLDARGYNAQPNWAKQPRNMPREVLEAIPYRWRDGVPFPAPVMLAMEFEEDRDRETFPTIEERWAERE